VQRNLTLTIDEDVLKAARKLALDRETSVNQMVREYLANLVHENDRQAHALKNPKEFWRTSKFRLSGPITWTRDELHERK
jgi:hypothetical protein